MSAKPPAVHRKRSVLSPYRATARLFFAIVAAVIGIGVVASSSEEWWQRMVVGWDVGALTLVGLAWWVIARTDSAGTKRRAGSDDPGRHLVFAIALASSAFSLFAAAYLFKQARALSGDARTVWTVLALASIALSWTMTHTAYALRYAHIYYRNAGGHGLDFPGKEPPADSDFAYFAFTVGMCFQVSDVVVSSTECRRAVLLHAVLSFVYNTTIVALTLNLVIGLMG